MFRTTFLTLSLLLLIAAGVFAQENSEVDTTTIESEILKNETATSKSHSKPVSENEEKSSKELEARDGRVISETGGENVQNSIDAGDNIQTIKAENIPHELDSWKAPYEIQKAFVYYHAGFDDEDRPIWMWELGKWNFRVVTDAGEEAGKNFDKYMNQMVHRIIKSLDERSTPDSPVTKANVLIDMDEFNFIQMAHVPTVQLILRTLRAFRPIIDLYLNVGVIVNTNAAANMLITLVRPLLGNIMERVDIYGTNKASWIPRVLNHFPKESLPKWYGGVKDFKPLKVYG